IWTATNDYIWNTQEQGNADQNLSPEQLADRYLTTDGTRGRLATLLRGGGPIVLVTHWQSLFSNGSRLGLATYQEIVARIGTLCADQVAWRTLSEITDQFLAAQHARFASQATEHDLTMTVTSPFAADILTISIPTPWPLYSRPTVDLNGHPVDWVEKPMELSF